MPTEHDPLDRLEQELAADEATLATSSLGLLADVENRKAAADKARRQATTTEERLAAHLDGRQADIDAITAMSAASRMDWELGQMIDPQQD